MSLVHLLRERDTNREGGERQRDREKEREGEKEREVAITGKGGAEQWSARWLQNRSLRTGLTWKNGSEEAKRTREISGAVREVTGIDQPITTVCSIHRGKFSHQIFICSSRVTQHIICIDFIQCFPSAVFFWRNLSIHCRVTANPFQHPNWVIDPLCLNQNTSVRAYVCEGFTSVLHHACSFVLFGWETAQNRRELGDLESNSFQDKKWR